MARVVTVALSSLRSWRVRRGYTEQHLASLSPLRRNTIWRIEAGHPARVGTAQRLGEPLGVPVAYLQGPPPES